MIEGQLYSIFAHLTQKNMPFLKSGLGYMVDILSFGCHFYIK